MNIDELAESIGIDNELYLELVGDFLERGMVDLEEIDAAIEAGNADDAATAAHSVKGAAGSLNIMECVEIARKVENLALEGRMNELGEPVRMLKSKIQALSALVE